MSTDIKCEVCPKTTLLTPINKIAVVEYYTTEPSAIETAINTKLGLRYVCVKHTTGTYWIYEPQLSVVVARLGLHYN